MVSWKGGELNLGSNSILLTSPASDHSGSGIILVHSVTENTQGFGNLLHIHSDGTFIDAHGDAAATMPCQAIALSSGTGTYKVLLFGLVRDDSWSWTVGNEIYVSEGTSGDATQTIPTGSGNQVQRIGYALSATVMFFCPDYSVIELV